MIRIEDWKVADPDWNGYTAPELRIPRLCGRVFNHPRHPDGSWVKTTGLYQTVGRVVWTRSGSAYYLGSPDPEYVEWCHLNGYTIDEENPLKFKQE